MSGYVRNFKGKYKEKYRKRVIIPKLLKINNFISFFIDDDMLLEKYKTVWTKSEHLQDVELNVLLFYDDRYIFFNSLWKKIILASIFRQFCL